MDHNGLLESDPALSERFQRLNNFPKRLKQAGYVTGMAGKSHLGSNDSADLAIACIDPPHRSLGPC